jgi:hypothetical protein
MNGTIPGIGISNLVYGTVWVIMITACAFRGRR